MIRISKELREMFQLPCLFFTLGNQPRSQEVVSALSGALQKHGLSPECRVFDSSDEIVNRLDNNGIQRNCAVALFDAQIGKRFSATTPIRPDHAPIIPAWTNGVQWVIRIGPSCRFDAAARQIAADFGKNFGVNLSKGLFPWGPPRKKEPAPVNVKLPAGIAKLLTALNDGPDLAGAIADQVYALELPPKSKISWIRIPPEPMVCDRKALERILFAFRCFEQASDKLVSENSDVRALLLEGVDFPIPEELRELYLFPPKDNFSVRRPDLHYTGEGVFASENDEMPGGFAEVVHLDYAYGLNQPKWRWCFDWLTSQGPLIFLVSHNWSRCYYPELKWLAEHMTKLGYNARFISTEELDKLTVT